MFCFFYGFGNIIILHRVCAFGYLYNIFLSFTQKKFDKSWDNKGRLIRKGRVCELLISTTK